MIIYELLIINKVPYPKSPLSTIKSYIKVFTLNIENIIHFKQVYYKNTMLTIFKKSQE